MSELLDIVHEKVVDARHRRADIGLGQPDTVHLSPIVYKALKAELESHGFEETVDDDGAEFLIDGVTVRKGVDMPAIKIR